MIEPSWEFELRHPWLTMLLYMCYFVLAALALGLPAWGWVELRFSPIQRHYLPAYMDSSVTCLSGGGAGDEVRYVDWIEKRAPSRDWVIAAPEDLVPAEGDGAPFALSPAARAQGWSELGLPERGASKERDIRDFLRAEFFQGHSFVELVLEPFELLLFGFLSWKAFESWREELARERINRCDGYVRPTGRWEDFVLLVRLVCRTAKAGAARALRWTARRMERWAEARRSQAEAVPVMATEVVPAPAPMVEVVSVRSPEPAAPAASMPQPAPEPAPRSPFGRPPADGEPVRKWDISQWIN